MELSLDVVSHTKVSSSNCYVKKHGGWFSLSNFRIVLLHLFSK
jgi:hypothetical protein